jgi:hypothetical protein
MVSRVPIPLDRASARHDRLNGPNSHVLQISARNSFCLKILRENSTCLPALTGCANSVSEARLDFTGTLENAASVRDSHLDKIAEGGAPSVVIEPGNIKDEKGGVCPP